ncbi:MAG TPA: hypothetical protein PK624_04660 [Spirochaetota bacterium]|nr:hypothetical protein [Spirochaetota bacterium]HOR44067.1 hypothetical protein [Spirochaetota bacterium]HPK56197.1 hypothetical protein [Spirochaetota bacterium]
MIKNKLILFSALALSVCGSDKSSDMTKEEIWTNIKENAAVVNELPSEFYSPFMQNLSTMGWEDGIHISRDGLDLYCVYVPGDMLSFSLAGLDPDQFGPYLRGPLYGMDLVSNPAGRTSWIHGDVLYSHRNSLSERFSNWTNSGVSKSVFSEGAPFSYRKSGAVLEKFVFTSNNKPTTYDLDIWSVDNTGLNPSGSGAPLANFPHSDYTEDNPDMENVGSNTIVLMFDSNDYPGGLGSHDIYYSISNDNGASWSAVDNLSTVNTASQEHQPHLYRDSSGDYFLYFSATNIDGKLAVFRVKQQNPGDWNSWGSRQLVVSAGNTAGVGEPTLTDNGDLSFVVVYENSDGGNSDRYDADPWYMPKR